MPLNVAQGSRSQLVHERRRISQEAGLKVPGHRDGNVVHLTSLTLFPTKLALSSLLLSQTGAHSLEQARQNSYQGRSL